MMYLISSFGKSIGYITHEVGRITYLHESSLCTTYRAGGCLGTHGYKAGDMHRYDIILGRVTGMEICLLF